MARFARILVTDKSSPKATSASAAAAAPPPEAVALESDFVIILAVLLCALICMVGLIAAARCAWRRRGSDGASANRYPSPPASANKGVKKKVLQSLPKFTYTARETTIASQENTNGRGANVKLAAPLTAECAICLGEFVEGDEIRVLPQCGHGFHVACIDKWLGSHSTCPSCRQILVVGRCQKCGQFPAVSLTPAVAGTSAGSEPEPRQLNNNTEDRLSTTTTINNAFLP